MHGLFDLTGPRSDPLRAYEAASGLRGSHCFPHGPGRTAKRINGEWRIIPKAAPPEWHEPQGESYRLVLGPKPACFTPLGIKSKRVRNAMACLARRGIPVSLEILQPRRRRFVLRRGD